MSSAAAVVSTLLTEAGCIGVPAPWAHSCAPVDASVTRPVKAPRFGSATKGARVAVSRSGVGLGAESPSGVTPGSTVASAGWGVTALASLVGGPPEVNTPATATTRGHDEQHRRRRSPREWIDATERAA